MGVLQIERQIAIMNLLKQEPLVRVDELSRQFGVSTNTIRRDLRSMEEQGLLRLTHGGAVGPANLPMGQPITDREDQYVSQKRCIGEFAANMIADGATVILDAGTTTEQIARAFAPTLQATVITNGLNVAQSLIQLPKVTVILVGGILNNTTYCTAGFHAEEFLSSFQVSCAFLSAGGEQHGTVFNTNVFEVQIKQQMMDIAGETYLVCTSNKFGTPSLAAFADLSDFTGVITDSELTPNRKADIERVGIRVWICDMSDD